MPTTDLFPKDRTAVFSPCRRWRYVLSIVWDAAKPMLICIMLNPSTADELKNDPTVERMERRARMGGFGGLIVLNAFAFRATDPKDMKVQGDPVGADNDNHILDYLAKAKASGWTVFVGWGTHGTHLNRHIAIAIHLRNSGIEAVCLSTTKNGQPVHPLYWPYDAPLVPWRAA